MAATLKSLAIAAWAAGSVLCGTAFAGPAAPSSILHSGPGLQLTGSTNKAKAHSDRRGGYSYNQADSINTYGDSRSKFGGASSLRDSSLDKQTDSGPFDHGFFFDSGTTARGGDSPYMN